jgi:aminomethyltransferase
LTRRTPLHDRHLAAGARMTDFSGWDMPLHYGSQMEEHHRVRRAAGMFDVSHMLAVDVTGADAMAFLRRLLANDVARLDAAGRGLYACMLNLSGGVIDDLIVHRFDDHRHRLVVNAGNAESDVAWMVGCRDSWAVDAQITPRRDLAMLAVQGPAARAAVWRAHPAWQSVTEEMPAFTAAEAGPTLVARTGYTGEDGFEITLPADSAGGLWDALLADGVQPCGLGARDTLRLEAGMNLHGADMDAHTSPMECGLAWTVDRRTDRDFVGREALERQTPARAQVGLRLHERGVLRGHMRVRTACGDGEITSGTFAPTLGFSIALACVPRDSGAVPRPGTSVEVDVRGRWLPASIVKPPFVRHGQSLLEPRPFCC